MSQLALFAPQPPAIKRTSQEITWERATSAEVEKATLAIFAAMPDQWLDWENFRPVIDGYQIGSCFGHALGRMARRGLIKEKHVYFGRGIDAERPGSPGYQGFKSVYMLAEVAP